MKLEFDRPPWYLITPSPYLSTYRNLNCDGFSQPKNSPGIVSPVSLHKHTVLRWRVEIARITYSLQDHIVNIDQFDTTLFCVKKILQKSKLIISMLLISSTVFRVKFISSFARNELFLFFGQLTSFGISIASRSWMIKACRLITRWYVNAIDFFVLCKILRNIAHVYPLSELLV